MNPILIDHPNPTHKSQQKMAEEFQSGVYCGGNWWNPAINLFRPSAVDGGVETFGCLNHHHDYFRTPSSISDGSTSDRGGAVEIQVGQNPRDPSDNGNMCSTLIFGDDWSQDYLNDSGRSEDKYPDVLQDAPCRNSDTSYQEQALLDCPEMDANVQQTYAADSLTFSDYNPTMFQMLFEAQSSSNDSITNPSLSPNHQMNSAEAFWNSVAAADTSGDVWTTLFPTSTRSEILPSNVLDIAKPNYHLSAKHHEEVEELASEAKKDSYGPEIKRPRIETPSPLPTFKVRKEKLGDRITALQQLVSPFGKTDTASVLHEAIEYIKFLHDQVLSAPYLRDGSPLLQHQQAGERKPNYDQEGVVRHLKDRGLCLVPISSSFPVAAETCTTDFWTPILGGSFR